MSKSKAAPKPDPVKLLAHARQVIQSLLDTAELSQDNLEQATNHTLDAASVFTKAIDNSGILKPPTRRVKCFRLWPGEKLTKGTWDVRELEVPVDTPPDRLEAAVEKAAHLAGWERMPLAVRMYLPEAQE